MQKLIEIHMKFVWLFLNMKIKPLDKSKRGTKRLNVVRLWYKVSSGKSLARAIL